MAETLDLPARVERHFAPRGKHFRMVIRLPIGMVKEVERPAYVVNGELYKLEWSVTGRRTVLSLQ